MSYNAKAKQFDTNGQLARINVVYQKMLNLIWYGGIINDLGKIFYFQIEPKTANILHPRLSAFNEWSYLLSRVYKICTFFNTSSYLYTEIKDTYYKNCKYCYDFRN